MKTHLAIFMTLVSFLGLQSCTDLPETQRTDALVLFEDDFSDPTSGWYQNETDDGITDYFNDGYRIFVNRPNYYLWSILTDQSFSDVQIEVAASKIDGPDVNEFGVICRYLDQENFYFFTISSDGYYCVGKFIDGVAQWIGMDRPQFDDINIRIGSATNIIQATCNGRDLSLTVNGKLLVGVSDPDLDRGNVGLIAGTWDTPGTDIIFDNFKVVFP